MSIFPLSGWILFIVLGLILFLGSIIIGVSFERLWISVIVGILLVAMLFGGLYFYYNHTASGLREKVNNYSELNNGIERTIRVLTADGEVIAEYSGKIDLQANDGGYVLFDYNGYRYTYYNCFVESIAEIAFTR